MARALRIADPEDGGNDQDPPAPAAVKPKPKASTKAPKEVELEKKVSTLEDRLGTVEGIIGGINEFLEGVFPGGKPQKTPPQESKKGFLDGVFDGIL